MAKILDIQSNIAPLAYMPRPVMKHAMLAYVLALLACNMYFVNFGNAVCDFYFLHANDWNIRRPDN